MYQILGTEYPGRYALVHFVQSWKTIICFLDLVPLQPFSLAQHKTSVDMSCSLNDLPNEVIQEILLHVPPICIPAFQQVSSKFNRLAGSLVWRHHCQTQFKYWSPQHRMREKFSANVEEVDWKSIFAERYRIDCATSHAVDSILSSQVGRIEKAQLIVKYGYDAKDCLLRNLRSTQRTEDILARQYASSLVRVVILLS